VEKKRENVIRWGDWEWECGKEEGREGREGSGEGGEKDIRRGDWEWEGGNE
jgi:hypothetical protein